MSHDFASHYGGSRSLGEFALGYAFEGYAVLPLARGGKKPHPVLGYEGGVHKGSNDPQLVRRWWRDAPHANVGVACGQANNGLVVIDLDVKHGASGPAELWNAVGAWVPQDAPWAATPSGGRHLWLRWSWDGTVPNRVGILPGVDIKGDGGYVVVPPSGLVMPRLEKGQDAVERIVPYSWEGGCPCTIPWVPDALGEWMATAEATGKPVPLMQAGSVGISASEAAAQLQPGSRNNSLSARAASLFRRYGTDQAGLQQVTDDLRTVWEQMDRTGFPWSEMATIITHARAFVQRREREEEAWTRQAEQGWLRHMRPPGKP